MNIPATELPVPIGSEIELQIVNGNGEILRGEELIRIWNAIFDTIEVVFKRCMEFLPVEIRQRIIGVRKVTKEKQGRQLPYIEIEYKTLGRVFHINAIGPDPNISQVTWIMELVTPPATGMLEFAWLNVLLNTALARSLPAGYWVLPLGLNPIEKEYLSGVTYGEHYHIGIDDPALKLAVYLLIRNFIPQLIALTVNSPLLNKKPTGTVKLTEDAAGLQILGKDCTRSLRLFHNKAQMGPVDKETYIPPLETLDHEAFCEIVRRKPPDDRFVDMNPFTAYGTIELRVFDTQLSLSRRLAIVALIEALCLKAKRLIEKGEGIPSVMSSVLIANREKAVLFGLHGKFTPDTLLPTEFGMTYNEDPQTGKQNGKLFQAAASMLFFLKQEISELGLEEIVAPLHLSIEGNEKVRAPVALADYLLYLYERNGGDPGQYLPPFKTFQTTYCTGDPILISDPLVDEWGVASSTRATTPTEEPSTVTPTPEMNTAITGLGVEVSESQIKTTGPIPYKLKFIASASGPPRRVEILAIQQLIETQKKSEIVLATSFKRLRVISNTAMILTNKDFPLSPSQDLFVGNKQCRLKFVIKEHKDFSTYSNSFRIELLPKYAITSEFKRKKVEAAEKLEVKYKIATTGNNIPDAYIILDLKFQVLSGDLKTILHEETRSIKVKDQENYSFKLVPQAAWKEREIVLRLAVLLNEKVIARHEIEDITLDIPEDKVPPSVARPGEKKGDFWPKQKSPASAPPATVAEDKYGLVRTLDFSKNVTAEVKQPPVTSPKPKQANNAPVVKKVESHTPKVQVPVEKKPAQRAKVTTTSPAPPANSAASSPAAQGIKTDQERMATLLSQDAAKQPATIQKPLAVPFIEQLGAASKKLEITTRLQSPKLVAPGEKIVVQYTMKKKGIIDDDEPLKMLAFLVNARREFMVVLNDRYRLSGETSTFTLTIDQAKQFKGWKPTAPFHVVLQVYKGNTLVGQAIYSDFELARFTTSSQISWKKIDLLSSTIYPGMDVAFDLELDLKSIVNPVAISIEASCQGTKVTADFTVASEGSNRALAPFRVPFQGLTPVPSENMFLKIKDSSGMTIKEQKKIVSIIARGPTFVISHAKLDTMEGLDKATLIFDIMNDSKQEVACHVSAMAIDIGEVSHVLAERKIKLKGNEIQHLELENVQVPLNAIRSNVIVVDFLVEIADFNKIKNLVRQVLPVDASPGNKVDVYFYGKLKNLDRVHEITAHVDQVKIEMETRMDINLGSCKAKLMEIVDGIEYRVIKTVKIAIGKEKKPESITWKPPRAKNYPHLCKLEIQFFQDDDAIAIERVVTEPLFFTIFPD